MQTPRPEPCLWEGRGAESAVTFRVGTPRAWERLQEGGQQGRCDVEKWQNPKGWITRGEARRRREAAVLPVCAMEGRHRQGCGEETWASASARSQEFPGDGSCFP